MHVPASYALKTYGMSRDELFDLLDQYQSGEEHKAAQYFVAFMEGLAKK